MHEPFAPPPPQVVLVEQNDASGSAIQRLIEAGSPIHGIAKMLRLFAGIARKYASRPELLRLATIDGLPGYVSIDRGDFLQTTALEVREGRIAAIYITRNPDKLRHVAALVEAHSDTP